MNQKNLFDTDLIATKFNNLNFNELLFNFRLLIARNILKVL